MDWLLALFFGAGVAAYTYSHFARRVGYQNTQNVALVVGTVFVLTSIVFLTILKLFVHM